MANENTGLGDGTGFNVFGDAVIKAAWDKHFEFALRSEPLLRDIADKRPVQVTSPGETVTFFIHSDIAKNVTPLTDGTDVTPIALPTPTTVTVTLQEHGATIKRTRILREFALSDVDPYVANEVAWNMRDSLDEIVQTELRGGTNVFRGDGSLAATNLVDQDSEGTHKLTSNAVRTVVTKLRGASVVPKREGLYGAYVHPDVAFDLKGETGAAAWRDPHNYTAPSNIWRHVVGVYEGAYFVESPRMYSAEDGAVIGAGPAVSKVYRSIFCGQQALAEAVTVEPQLVIGNPGADHLNRLYTVGWYTVIGWKRFREAALYRAENVSTIN